MRRVALSLIAVAMVLAAGPSRAEPMNADAARRFVLGKLFAFTCYDGSRGAGRIYGDGSVIGTVQFQGSGPVRSLWLPAGTLKIKGDTYCAAVKGMPFEPCFNLNRMSDRSFRGSVSGMGFAYCDFTKRLNVAGFSPRSRAAGPLALSATSVTAPDGE